MSVSCPEWRMKWETQTRKVESIMRLDSSLPVAALTVLVGWATGEKLQAADSNGLLAQWKEGPNSAAAEVGNARIGGRVIRNFPSIGWQWIQLPPDLDSESGLKAYRALDSVAAVESNTAIVPPEATSGPITIVTPHGSVTSSTSLQVLPPRLSVRLSPARGVEVNWPGTSTEFQLESTADLGRGVWTPVPEAPARVDGASTLTLSPSTGTRFFRLRRN